MTPLFRRNPAAEPDHGCSIQAAETDDICALDRIEQEAFSTPWSLDLIRGAVLNSRYQVRVLRAPGGPVIGFYIAHAVDASSNLDNLAVDSSARRLGWGRRLVDDWIAVAHSQDLSTLTLQVNTRNLPAQRLYRGFAFKPLRLLVGYYPNGEDAYQMEKVLTFQSRVFRPRAAI
jgi:ribosomal-protein-alanine N-acetyltransferase